ncbi:MAG: hypothetical protein WCY58_05095 [Mariniphaga sp.]
MAIVVSTPTGVITSMVVLTIVSHEALPISKRFLIGIRKNTNNYKISIKTEQNLKKW